MKTRWALMREGYVYEDETVRDPKKIMSNKYLDELESDVLNGDYETGEHYICQQEFDGADWCSVEGTEQYI